ncbi:MAG: exodeoxyribonuclease III [Peptoniphilaceae bacterium]|nr:exodeoxyribonuclease III [Peptoniphilaceae bacterium]MDD7382941.1 exodeoxyribonuclease III [Peptoniphilaceae bacterium]MDY3737692.1 exodeoxyribonuclease III [Peptoniphilaceae bacterium]
MKLFSWNVNGLRAAIKKGFLDFFETEKPDIIGLQEIKLSEGQIDLNLQDYHQFWNYANKKGYSGTAVFSKKEPISVEYDMGIDEHDHEGRIIKLEFEDFYFITVYTPNSKRNLERLDYRQIWEDDFRSYLNKLKEKKPVIVCGDLNVAHKEIDLANPSTNHKNAGFTDEEREKFSELLNSGFLDTFRYFYPDKEKEYSRRSYFAKSRERNIGWRIDYFLASEEFKDNLVDAGIMQEVLGSDHCPIWLEIK